MGRFFDSSNCGAASIRVVVTVGINAPLMSGKKIKSISAI